MLDTHHKDQKNKNKNYPTLYLKIYLRSQNLGNRTLTIIKTNPFISEKFKKFKSQNKKNTVLKLRRKK